MAAGSVLELLLSLESEHTDAAAPAGAAADQEVAPAEAGTGAEEAPVGPAAAGPGSGEDGGSAGGQPAAPGPHLPDLPADLLLGAEELELNSPMDLPSPASQPEAAGAAMRMLRSAGVPLAPRGAAPRAPRRAREAQPRPKQDPAGLTWQQRMLLGEPAGPEGSGSGAGSGDREGWEAAGGGGGGGGGQQEERRERTRGRGAARRRGRGRGRWEEAEEHLQQLSLGSAGDNRGSSARRGWQQVCMRGCAVLCVPGEHGWGVGWGGGWWWGERGEHRGIHACARALARQLGPHAAAASLMACSLQRPGRPHAHVGPSMHSHQHLHIMQPNLLISARRCALAGRCGTGLAGAGT